MANLKIQERNDFNAKCDADVRAYKAKMEDQEKLISHLKDAYEDCHDNLSAMQNEKQQLEHKLSQREHEFEQLASKQQDPLIKTPAFGNETLDMFTMTPSKNEKRDQSSFRYPEPSEF